MLHSKPRSLIGETLWGAASLFSSFRTRAIAIVAVFTLGVLVYLVFAPVVGSIWLIAAEAALLSAPVAVAKTATACGINALGTFSRYDRPAGLRVGSSLVYALTAVISAALVGTVASWVGSSWLPSPAIVLAAPFFAVLGLREFGVFADVPVPTSRWQVPARWVQNERLAPIVWGVFLGSGFATWMPHATFYALLFLAAVLPWPSGTLLMALYGLTRAVPGVLAALSRRYSGEIVRAHSLDLRLLGHALTGVVSLSLSGVVFTWWIVDWPVIWQALATINVGLLFGATIAVAAGLFFAASALGKLVALGAFRAALRETYSLPEGIAAVAAPGVVALEVVCAVLLLLPETRVVGLLAGSALTAAFVLSAASAVVAGGAGDCGCLGVLRRESLGPRTLVRGVGLLAAMAGAALVSASAGPTATVPSFESSTPVALVASAMALLVGAALFTSVSKVLRLRKPVDE